jgi:NADPH-dependent 2,4-dienoyl-CoA reductase/sulfur reductase-like enzyme
VPDESVDVVVYGGTPGGLIAAVAAARLGASTLVLEQTGHVGGLSTSGLDVEISQDPADLRGGDADVGQGAGELGVAPVAGRIGGVWVTVASSRSRSSWP